MKAIHKGKVVEVWKIGKDTPQPDWVRQAIQKKLICWIDNHVRILMAGLTPSVTVNLKIGATGTLGGGFAGYGMYVLGYPGDYLDISNHRVVSAKQFYKEYDIIEEST